MLYFLLLIDFQINPSCTDAEELLLSRSKKDLLVNVEELLECTKNTSIVFVILISLLSLVAWITAEWSVVSEFFINVVTLRKTSFWFPQAIVFISMFIGCVTLCHGISRSIRISHVAILATTVAVAAVTMLALANASSYDQSLTIFQSFFWYGGMAGTGLLTMVSFFWVFDNLFG